MTERALFDRETYFNWAVTRRGTTDQLKRYRHFVELYDANGVETPGELNPILDRLERPEKSPTVEIQFSFEIPPASVDSHSLPAAGVVADAVIETIQQPQPAGEADPYPEFYTGYPAIGLAAIVNDRGRAWAVWMLSKALSGGTGKVPVSDLRAALDHFKVSDRQQRRWIASALALKLMAEGVTRRGERCYFPVRHDRAGLILEARDIWKPAKMRLADIFQPARWHRFVWASFLATLEGRPMSQQKKFELTGVEPRLQRLWQAPNDAGVSLSYPTYNYANSNVDPAHVEALRELTGWNYVVRGGEVRQRLPDGRVVCGDFVQPVPCGVRNRKVRKAFDAGLLLLGEIYQANSTNARLFNSDHDQAKRTLKRLSKRPHDERPLDIFEQAHSHYRVSNYAVIQV